MFVHIPMQKRFALHTTSRAARRGASGPLKRFCLHTTSGAERRGRAAIMFVDIPMQKRFGFHTTSGAARSSAAQSERSDQEIGRYLLPLAATSQLSSPLERFLWKILYKTGIFEETKLLYKMPEKNFSIQIQNSKTLFQK